MNRTWDTASPHAHPTVHTIRDVIDKLSKTVFTSLADKIFDANAFQENPLDFVLDIHVSNTLLGFFVVGNAYDSVFRWDIDFILGKKMFKHLVISFLQKRAAHCVSKDAGTKLPRLFQHEHNVQQGSPYSAFVKIMKKKIGIFLS